MFQKRSLLAPMRFLDDVLNWLRFGIYSQNHMRTFLERCKEVDSVE